MQAIQSLAKKQDNLAKKQEATIQNLAKHQKVMTQVLFSHSMPTCSSSSSLRKTHQADMKQAMRIQYQCQSPSNPDVTKCLVLNIFLSSTDVL